MLQPSISSPVPQSPPPALRFGLPRVYVVTQLRARLLRLLGEGACEIGYLDAQDHFVALDADDDFDGPAFVLKLRPAAREHVVTLQVSILYGVYRLQVLGLDVEIAVLPALDDARLMTTARRIVHTLEGVARVR
ncbi:hypothetical protein [Herbaspirillum sp. alder98]|uniref:hypothetical protein n=1 Tax=Herbaspirillum sp. alder98 TaxID=2913096 RepID=UPI001CD8D9C3|nr:hypothetical protein [Herbaspirillum sp. alder98]MCA1325564.1 hypothetical protein [Herbaspirillum sp. alder98]